VNLLQATLLVWLSLGPLLAHAHDARPLHVEVDERGDGLYRVSWRTPATVAVEDIPDVRLPATCLRLAPSYSASALDRQVLYRCAASLDGADIVVSYPRFNPSLTTLIRFQRLNGERRVAVLSPQQDRWRVPAAETTSAIAAQYLGFGMRHILEGYDHLLFVACLVFIARSGRRILITVTGFTVAHSVTLMLAALAWVRVPVAPVEASIALSIVFVASEIARGQRDTLTWRHPIAVSSSFGLLHGLGFAAVLREIGLPQTELPAALLFFNVGVEIGQVVFVAALLLLALVGRRILPARGWRLDRSVAYAVGSVAVFWTLQRVAAFA